MTTLASSSVTRRTIFIGDVHGCAEELDQLLRATKVNADDRVVFVGDLIGKGPRSIDVVRRVMSMPNASCVMGNHDAVVMKIVDAKERGESLEKYEVKEHFAIFKAMTEEQVRWITKLPPFLRLPELNVIAVHAGLLPNIPIESQPLKILSKIRNIIGDGATAEAAETTDAGEPWVQSWRGPETIIFGHDAARGLQLTDHCIGLDSGCVYGNFLTAYILPKGEWVSVKARKVYVEPKTRRIDAVLQSLSVQGRLQVVGDGENHEL